MAIRIVQLGMARNPDEGLRIGTVRRPPRGVRKEDYSKLDYYDVWMPELAPSITLVAWALANPFTPKRWSLFERRYRQEMRQPTPAPHYHIAGHTIIRDEFLHGLLLSRRGAMSSVRFTTAPS